MFAIVFFPGRNFCQAGKSSASPPYRIDINITRSSANFPEQLKSFQDFLPDLSMSNERKDIGDHIAVKFYPFTLAPFLHHQLRTFRTLIKMSIWRLRWSFQSGKQLKFTFRWKKFAAIRRSNFCLNKGIQKKDLVGKA